jgi:hypothetical protein
MARRPTPIILTSVPPEIAYDELTTCLAEATAILCAVILRHKAGQTEKEQ